jgi:hypothetical protein
MECPAGHRVKRQTNNLYRFQFQWPKGLKAQCTQSSHGRIVSFYKRRYFDRPRALVASTKGKKLLLARQIIVEGVIGEAKNLHLLKRCRYCSLERFLVQLFLTASAVNLKRLLKMRGKTIGTAANAASVPVCMLLSGANLLFGQSCLV